MSNPMFGPKEFIRTEVVRAMRFDGWRTVEYIREWAPDVFYVPRGAEHHLRRENEKDKGNGHILDTASEFLILKLSSLLSDPDARAAGRRTSVRIDAGEWIAETPNGFVKMLASQMSNYTEKMAEGEGDG